MAYLEYRPSQPLFQYTSVEGLFGILRSKRLRLSDLRAANDPREIELGLERVIKALAVLAQGENDRDKALLLNLIRNLTEYFGNLHAFCACFSLAVDELPMWGAYGQAYGGLAIGFRPVAITSLPGRVLKVNYLDTSTEEAQFKELALTVAKHIKHHRDTNNIESLVAAGVGAITPTLGFKHSSWTYEKEVRVVHVQRMQRPHGRLANLPVGRQSNGQFYPWQTPLERKAAERTVQYIEAPFGKFREGGVDFSRAIKTVIVGPHCALSVGDVEKELKEQGFLDCTVQKSECQIRA